MRMGMGEDQLMYIDKREIEKAEEWKIFLVSQFIY